MFTNSPSRYAKSPSMFMTFPIDFSTEAPELGGSWEPLSFPQWVLALLQPGELTSTHPLCGAIAKQLQVFETVLTISAADAAPHKRSAT